MAEPVRIGVLGACGEARAMLRELLTAAGGVVTIEGDPLELSPEEVDTEGLEVLILSLHPDSDERVLERWDRLLQRPGLNVIFDEAEISGRLAGWDQSRWARHLASKALGIDAFLPPVAPGHPFPPQADRAAAGEAAPGDRPDHEPPALSLDELLTAAGTAGEDDSEAGVVEAADEGEAGADYAAGGGGNRPSGFGELSLVPVDEAAGGSGRAAHEAARKEPELPPEVDFDRLAAGLGLVPGTPRLDRSEAAPRPRPAPAARIGAVVLFAGVGGPDALRRFLKALEQPLPVPVLVHQHLEQGNHDRLLPQLAKVSQMPVRLADAEGTASAGEVCVLPEGVGAEVLATGTLRFTAQPAAPMLIENLTSLCENCVLVLLSGTAADCVEPALRAGGHGVRVLAQDPGECFDAGASDLLLARGVSGGSAEQLAKWVMEQWQA